MAQINKPTDYFNTKLYTGTGSALSVTGVNFQPDMTWIKRRDAANGHLLQDGVRGATNVLFPDGTGAEVGGGTYFTSFDSDGFTVTSNAASGASGGTYASWNWLAGGTASSNTDGSITSSVSANTTSGFSIATYTGTGSNTNFGHGLSGKPDLVIIKNRDAADNWTVIPGNSNLFGGSYYLQLNSTAAKTANSDVYTSYPSATVNYLSTNHRVNASGENYVCYSFQSIKGYSKVGSYTGNGSADGPFVYTGFKPAWVMIKNTTSATSWLMKDNKRTSSGFNPIDKRMFANETSAESTAEDIDFVSNGFKMRTSGANPNVSGGSFIYMAFASEPLVTTSNIPCPAR